MLTQIQTRKPQKNKFNLSREAKLTCNMGQLVPVFMQEVIPGDSFKVDTQQLVRFSPLLAPAMQRIDFKLDYFYVPYRIIWDEWKDFITGGEDGNDLPSFPRWQVNTANTQYLKKGTLQDYLGLPAAEGGNEYGQLGGNNYFDLSILPQRAYQLIYHEYFRDQNVGTEYTQHTSSGVQQALQDQLTLRNTNWEKDYFTSALPFLQRGPEVVLPLGGIAPLETTIPSSYPSFADNFNGNTGETFTPSSPQNLHVNGLDSAIRGAGGSLLRVDVSGHTHADLSQATAATINELRKASALQQWLELMARAGSRYREQIFAMFGERIPDYTVQVPQYLGGGKTPIMISEVLSNYQDSQDPNGAPVGEMYGHAVGLGDNLGFTQSFDEHGVILGLARVVPKSSYVQGINKHWTKFDKFDHYFPQFANLGEQEVNNLELFVTGDPAVDDQPFGYQQRYAEYKYCHNTLAGDFIDELSFWELSRRFTNTPVLNQDFVECNDDSNTRIFAVEDEEVNKLWIQLYHSVDALRPMPYHANPMLT